jgi:hypothetical protein
VKKGKILARIFLDFFLKEIFLDYALGQPLFTFRSFFLIQGNNIADFSIMRI